MPVMPVLFEMEENGALIDAEKLHDQSAQIEQRLQELGAPPTTAPVRYLTGFTKTVSRNPV